MNRLKVTLAMAVLLFIHSAVFHSTLVHSSAVAAVKAVTQLPVQIGITDFGIYHLSGATDSAFDGGTTAGYASVINTRLDKVTRKIPLQQQLVFGFNYTIDDCSTAAEWVPVVIQIRHPLTSDYLGQTSVGFSQQSAARLKADGRYHNGAFYIFTEPYEMVTGEWTITVSYHDEVTASQSFYVFDPEQQR